ncbi:aldo/keto reductase [Fimicolochytrium jonesii]|uniref:aldo/keto reductase n=1 Tax=Fimicolochytrium jonesii TaxID=1396493 RepID=UPI0022FF40FC|nr:aldo/keto reductase [Fimicolochytrium jonesii]KAI8824468.1 aldo/keto reductase [Fimicolochytrium jonesii]
MANPLPIPRFLYGTAWKKDETHSLVKTAILQGFRGIDTACQPKHYNEPQVGNAIAEVTQNHNIPRSELFIQTKFTSLDGQDPLRIPYDKHATLEEQVTQSFNVSLKNLKVSYIDSLVLHSPMRTLEDTLRVWRVLEGFKQQNKVHYLGISNAYNLRFLQQLYQQVSVKPSFIQNRFYRETGWDRDIRSWAKEVNIKYQSFWTLTGNPNVLASPVIARIAKARECSPEQVMYKVLIQTGIVPLNGTKNVTHMKEDLAILQWENWSDEEIDAVLALVGGK